MGVALLQNRVTNHGPWIRDLRIEGIYGRLHPCHTRMCRLEDVPSRDRPSCWTNWGGGSVAWSLLCPLRTPTTQPVTGTQTVSFDGPTVGSIHRFGRDWSCMVVAAGKTRIEPLATKHRPEYWARFRIDRFVNEAQTLSHLQHPNIVPVHELGQLEDGRYYFTMKEVKGQPLSENYSASSRGVFESSLGKLERRMEPSAVDGRLYSHLCSGGVRAQSRCDSPRPQTGKYLDWGL